MSITLSRAFPRRRCQGSVASGSWRGLSLTSIREVRSGSGRRAGAESMWEARDGGVGQGETRPGRPVCFDRSGWRLVFISHGAVRFFARDSIPN
jgi:hypothetical protein